MNVVTSSDCEIEDDGSDIDDLTGERYDAAWCVTHGYRFEKKDGCPVPNGRTSSQKMQVG